MPAQKQSPSIPADSQEVTEEEAKEVNGNKETESDLIFPATIKQQEDDDNESQVLRARTGQRKRTPTSIYTNEEETKKEGSRKKKKQEKTDAGFINALGTSMKVARLILLIDQSMDLISKIEGYWDDSDGKFDGYVQQLKNKLKNISEVCNDLTNLLTNAIEAERKEQSDD